MRGPYQDRFEVGWHPFWFELISWLLLLLLLAALIGLAVWAAMRFSGGGRRGMMGGYGATGAWSSPEWSRHGQDQALQTVRLRYAQGEISREEYARLVADLGGQVPGPPPVPPGQAQAPPPAPPPSPPAPQGP